MKLLQDKVNVTPPDSDFPFGDLNDDNGTGNGTPANRELFTDALQFFEKLMSESGITANGLTDNEYSGWQLFEAFQLLTGNYKVVKLNLTQDGTSSSAPVPTYQDPTYKPFGTINWTRTGAGIYKGTAAIAGSFSGFKQVYIGTVAGSDIFMRATINDDEITVTSYFFNPATPGFELDDTGFTNIPITISVK